MNSKYYWITLLAGLYAFCTTLTHAEMVPIDSVVAIVDEGVILKSQLDERKHDIIERFFKDNTEQPPEAVFNERIIEQLITETTQLQMAKRVGIQIDDQTLNMALARLAQKSGKNLEQLKAQFDSEGPRAYEKYRNRLRDELVIQQLQRYNVFGRIQISDIEVNNFLESEIGKTKMEAQYHIAHILIPLSEKSNEEEETETFKFVEELQQKLLDGAHFGTMAATYSKGDRAANGGDFGWKKSSQLPSLFLNAIDKLARGEISEPIRSPRGLHLIKLINKRNDTDIVVKQTHIRQIMLEPTAIRSKEETKTLINNLHKRLQEGEDFSKLAREHSDDSLTKQQGGDLEWLDEGEMGPEYQKHINKTAVGTVSEPFEVESKWFIIEVLEERDQDISEELKQRMAKEFIAEQRFNEELQNWLKELRDQSYVKILLTTDKP